jgi:hypothetical protein
MSGFTNRATDTGEALTAYTTSLIDLLGGRDPFTVLRETPAALEAEIAGVPPHLLGVPEAPGKWSIRQVVQHLADSELVGGFRFRMVLAHDRPQLPGYDQDLWAERLRYDEADLALTLGDFKTLRRANLRLLERTSEAERARVSLHAERGEESLGRMLQLYAGHDLVHLRQIRRIRTVIGAV